MIREIEQTSKQQLSLLFKNMDDTVILSCLEGHMGTMKSNNVIDPTAGMIIVGDFVALAGNAYAEGSKDLIKNIPEESFIIAESKDWINQIKETYFSTIHIGKRYRFRKNKTDLDPAYIKKSTPTLPRGYELRQIDAEIVNKNSLHDLSSDFTGQFSDSSDYLDRGVGYAILYEDTIVAAASSYTIYNQGIEIEIATRREHRNQGLATIVASALILHCLDIGIYPSWDAANIASVHLAEKLGYVFKEEYEVLYT